MTVLALLVAGCSMSRAPKSVAAKAPASAPKPVVVTPAAAVVEPPFSAPQTNVVLPAPQPVSPEAAAVVTPAPEPPPAPPKPVRPPTSRPPAAQPEPPPPDPVLTPPPRPRVRPAESTAERRKLQAEFASRRRETEALLARLQGRTLSEEEKSAQERVRAFLDQAAAAIKKNDFQQADALSSRALLLAKDLLRE
ncbi:MAG: hypothetical protein HY013_14540 [Candidatus Solibacter usitatus]|nr:hypothetical protein [Candidatus Solibacter usitatus]